MHKPQDSPPAGAVTLKTVAGMSDFTPDEWRGLAGTSRDESETSYNPFISYDFLSILEESGTVSGRSGWKPQHLRLEDASGRLIGAVACYLKSNSQGEYVFDHAWAQAYERAGGAYYPKLQCAVPFTPATGPRIMARAEGGYELLLGGAIGLCRQLGASSLHVTFPEEAEWRRMGEAGLLLRQDQQYHWHNQGYACFEDFLAALSSSRRKTIRRERREARAGLEIEALSGRELTEAHWDAFFAFYMDTGSRKWGRPYLNRRFFSLLGERMADRVLLVMARREGRWIAGALNLIGEQALYGRNWGALEHRPFLHFELCYYQAIEQAASGRPAAVTLTTGIMRAAAVRRVAPTASRARSAMRRLSISRVNASVSSRSGSCAFMKKSCVTLSAPESLRRILVLTG